MQDLRKNFNINNPRGFTLLEIMITAGLMGIMALSFNSLTRMMVKSNAKSSMDADVTQMLNELNYLMSNSANCSGPSFKTASVAAGTALIGGAICPTGNTCYDVLSTTAKVGNKFVVDGVTVYGNSSLSIKSLYLAYPTTLGTSATMYVVYNNKKILQGPATISKKLTMNIAVTSGTLSSCNSAGGSSDLFQPVPASPSDRFFTGGNIGINNSAPTYGLTVGSSTSTMSQLTIAINNIPMLYLPSEVSTDTSIAVGDGLRSMDLTLAAGRRNTSTGIGSLKSVTTGVLNSAFGFNSLTSNAAGLGNSAFGAYALTSSTGNNNSAFGYAALYSSTTAQSNSAFGYQALYVNTGNFNSAFGDSALLSNTTGTNNTAMGFQSLDANTTGTFNVGIGNGALGANTTGGYNVGVGTNALSSTTTVSNLTAVGAAALAANTTGTLNSAFGSSALYSNTTGSNNIAMGYLALSSNSTGGSNVAIGNNSLAASASGAGLTAIGDSALMANTVGVANDAFGSSALHSNTSGFYNSAFGALALFSNTTGDSNVAFGYRALNANTTGVANAAFGYNSLNANTTGSQNAAFGSTSLQANTTGTFNSAFGISTLLANTIGNYNSAFGYEALYKNTTGVNNSASGSFSLFSNTTGVSNVAVGYQAMFSNTTGGYSVAIGQGALQASTTGGSNVAVGVQALSNNTTASSNSALGYNALWHNTTGTNNSAFGTSSLAWNATTSNNSAFGLSALGNAVGSDNTAVGLQALGSINTTTSIQNVALGSFAGNQIGNNTTMTDTNNSIYVGYLSKGLANTGSTNEIVIGASAVGHGSNTVTLGTITKTTAQYLYGTTYIYDTAGVNQCTITPGTASLSCTSDERLKKDIQVVNDESSLQNILKLETVKYKLKFGSNHNVITGYIAQKVQKLFPDLVSTDKKGYLSLAYSNLIPYLSGAIKSLYNKVMGIDQRVVKLEQENEKLKKELAARDLKMKEFENRLMKLERK